MVWFMAFIDEMRQYCELIPVLLSPVIYAVASRLDSRAPQ
jgi:hypothetical protein